MYFIVWRAELLPILIFIIFYSSYFKKAMNIAAALLLVAYAIIAYATNGKPQRWRN